MIPLLLAGIVALAALPALAAPPRPVIALTFDDIPSHGPLPPGETRVAIIARIVRALRQAGAPARGFVNGAFAEREPGAPEALVPWRAAGLPVGNHGWSHLNLDTVGPVAFKADIIRNEPLLGRLDRSGDWRWLRYPFLAEGKDSAVRADVRRFAEERGYRVAPVTMSFGDFLWSAPYARCKAARDRRAIAALQRSFLASAGAAADAARAAAQARYGRDIPYVLLLHVGASSADMLPRLLALYRKRGFAFVSLEQAVADQAYQAATPPPLVSAPPAPLLLPGAGGAQPATFDKICTGATRASAEQTGGSDAPGL